MTLIYGIHLICSYLSLVFVRGDDNSTSFNSNFGPKNITSGTFRLMDGSRKSEGRVEVFHDGRWGTVCHRGWFFSEAGMVCRSMGFQGAKSFSTFAHYGQGTGNIWLSGVNCPVGSISLCNCTHESWGENGCTHVHDAGADCTDCQANIGGIERLNCNSCFNTSHGKCDPNGCPALLTYYNNQTHMCEIEAKNKSYECDENHMLRWNINMFDRIMHVLYLLECLHLCISNKVIVCAGVNYEQEMFTCMLYIFNKYTVPKDEYDNSALGYVHCAIGYCPQGHAVGKNKSCVPCPVNTYKLHRGTPCMPCKIGFDTNRKTAAAKCSKTCVAGYQSLDGTYCEACPKETYKKTQ